MAGFTYQTWAILFSLLSRLSTSNMVMVSYLVQGGGARVGPGGQREILNSIPLCPWSWLSFPLCTGSAHVWGPRPLRSLRNQSQDFSNSSSLLKPCQNTLISRVYFPLETWNVIFDLNVFPTLSTLPGSWRTLTYIIIITMVRTAKMY